MRNNFFHDLAVGDKLQAQHPMRGRVLGPHVDNHLLRADGSNLLLIVFQSFSITRHLPLFYSYSMISFRILVVFPEWMSLPIARQENTSQVRMADKIHPHEVERFALVPICRAPHR